MEKPHSAPPRVFASLAPWLVTSLLFALASAAPVSSLAATADAPFVLQATKTTVPPRIDGTLDDPQWKAGLHVTLGWNFTYRRGAQEATDVYMLSDAKYLYVAFDAKQTEPLVATQHVNDQPLGSDDVVRVYFFPGGERGFEYMFAANPIGTRYEFSSENAAFAPAWDAVAKQTPGGYVITERIPLGVMRGDGRSEWRVQFDRRVYSMTEVFEWAHDGGQTATDSSHFTGYLRGMTGAAGATRAKPRLNLYGLGDIASKSAGGSTSRMGADFAMPITQTASLLLTAHPDYSNVELDQQTISPTAFPRQYQEVRPFFTQGANFYNTFNCNDCIDYPQLYTFNIPTPRDGLAVEGVQGQATFGAFDALGDDRTDTAQSFAYRTPDRVFETTFQRFSTDTPGIHDIAQLGQVTFGNAHNFSMYATLGGESGTFVTSPSDGRYQEFGLNFYTPKEGIFAAYHNVGSQYAPIDSYVSINDVKGMSVFATREFDNSPKDFIQNVVVSNDYAQYTNHLGALDYGYHSAAVTVNTRVLLSLQATSGSFYLLFPGLPGGMANQNGIGLSYNVNGATPTTYSYNIGRFAEGYLRSSARSTTWRVFPRATVTLEADDTNDTLDDPRYAGVDQKFTQWLERASFAYQINRTSSFTLGVRKIIGTAPPFFAPPVFTNATNIASAFYHRFNKGELYVAYGDPSQLTTRAQFIMKYILYIGAQKGT